MGIRLRTISSIKDNIIYCSNNSSTSFIGERVKFYINDSNSSNIVNDLYCKGLIFEAIENNFKIWLIQGEQQHLCIFTFLNIKKVGYEIYGTSKTIRIKVGFSILGKTINPFGNILSYHVTNNNDSVNEEFLENLFEKYYIYISSSSRSIIYIKKLSKPLLTLSFCNKGWYTIIRHKNSSTFLFKNVHSKTNMYYCTYKPVKYNFKHTESSKIDKEISHLKESFTFKEDNGNILSDKSLYYENGEYRCYYTVFCPSETSFILRPIKQLSNRDLLDYRNTAKTEITAFYELSNKCLTYKKFILSKSFNKYFIVFNFKTPSDFIKNKFMELNIEEVIHIYSEELALEYYSFNKYLKVGDIVIKGNNLFQLGARQRILFKKVNINKKKTMGFFFNNLKPYMYLSHIKIISFLRNTINFILINKHLFIIILILLIRLTTLYFSYHSFYISNTTDLECEPLYMHKGLKKVKSVVVNKNLYFFYNKKIKLYLYNEWQIPTRVLINYYVVSVKH